VIVFVGVRPDAQLAQMQARCCASGGMRAITSSEISTLKHQHSPRPSATAQ
jgi:hypothetical protein